MNEPRLVIALLNAMWQTAIIAVFTASLLRVVGRTSASARCAVWMLAFFVSASLPVFDYLLVKSVDARQPIAAPAAQPAIGRSEAAVGAPLYLIVASPPRLISALKNHRPPARNTTAAARFSVASPSDPTPETAPMSGDASASSPRPARPALRTLLAQQVDRASSVLFWTWVAMALVLGVRLALQFVVLVRTKAAVKAGDFSHRFHPASAGRPYSVGLSDAVAVPCLLGLVKPVIAIPASLARELSAGDLRRIVLHESAHVRRYDDWFNFFEQLALTLLFFNPALHYIARSANLEREIACDDHVIASEDKLFYAECLTTLAQRTHLNHAFVVPGFIASRQQLLVRIEQMLDRRHIGSASPGRLPYAVMALISGLALGLSQFGIPVLAANTAGKPAHQSSSAQQLASAMPTKTIKLIIHPVPPARSRACVCRPARIVRTGAVDQPRVHARTSTPRASADRSSHDGFANNTAAFSFERDFQVTAIRVRPLRDATIAIAANSRALALAGAPLADVSVAAQPAMTVAANAPVVAAGATPAARSPKSKSPSKGTVYIIYSLRDAQTLIDHGVTDEYIKALRAAGYTVLKVQDLTMLADHGVSAAYAAELRAAAGVQASARALAQLRDHDVSAEYLRSMRPLIHSDADLQAMMTLRDHDVSASLARAAATLARERINVKALTQLSDHGVTAEYLRAMTRVRYQFNGELPDIAVKEITELRDHGVTTEYIASLAAAGYSSLPAKDIIRLFDHGVSAGYITRLRRAHNNTPFSVDELIRMHDSGV